MFWSKEKLNKDLIEYAEQEAKILAEFQIDCTDSLERSANTLLNILLGGAGGSLALAVTFYEKGTDQWLTVGALGTSIYLFLLCGILIKFCLWVKEIWPPANLPKHLYSNETKDLDLIFVRRDELINSQEAIDFNSKRNKSVGLWLNRVRSFALLTPIVIIFSFLVF